MLALFLALQAAALGTPPPLQAPDCFPGPWIVFFDRNGATLDAEDRHILDLIVATKRGSCGGTWRLRLVGHADRGERADTDRRRAEAVRRYLRGRRLPAKLIRVERARAGRPRVVSGLTEAQKGRVEIMPMPL